MKFNALIAATAALASIAAPALADAYLDRWAADAKVKVEQKLAKAGLPQGAQTIDVRVRIDGEGGLESPQVVASSGSTELDAAVIKAMRHVQVGQTPPELSGRTLTFHLAVTPAQTASLPVAPKP